ncbi:MAG: glycoside hydrolase family 2 TIM barrel-domain containing protein [Prevotella sp.]|nr:glycoside hydrolase family 2 TIM barrel-domain containing protein [Prevotella sp.]
MKNLLFILLAFACLTMHAQQPTSVAGFLPIENQGREVWNFNLGWRFHLGDAEGAWQKDYDDSRWETVSTPHNVRLEPAEASGCRNYQGIAWYRKHFTLPADGAMIYFEAVMGKQKIYINGKLATTHFGGYLPIIVRLDKMGLHKGDKCVIAVMTDNSDDGSYPPGKPQTQLDFAYHGGIYRDVWLIARHKVHITDANEAGKTAGGGVFVHFSNISAQRADVSVNTDIINESAQTRVVTVEQQLLDAAGHVVRSGSQRLKIQPGATAQSILTLKVSKPNLWSPEEPYLYKLVTRVKEQGKTLDGGATRVGIRSFEFRGKEGFWLNGKPYHQLIGANRHQDFAYVGNALPNSQQWRDALRLKRAGFNIIRTAHYPQDPAFMDACDELGIFMIVATPGWQYWNKKQPEFEQRVYENTREMIRRDRNHPCVLMWEPILNETRFPESFALKSLQITKDEYPYPYRPVAAADMNSAGVRDNYDVVYGWPGDEDKADCPKQCIFTREFGEYVDDWYAQNNINRASRSWGEHPMMVQAMSLASTLETMYQTKGQFIGGAQWHPFDHQRGYHPDPYWGGDYDAFRQPKTAFYMFASQQKPRICKANSLLSVKPMVHIANDMTQFSDSDVVVFSNCDSVRLSIYDGEKQFTLPVIHTAATQQPGSAFSQLNSQFAKPVVFKNVWNFWEARQHSYIHKKWQEVNIKAEGIIGGKVVCAETRMPSRRSTKLRLYADDMGKSLVADGNDFMVVVAEVTDDNGNVRRLAKESVRFTVTGEGSIIGDADIQANPRAVEYGSAPILVRSTTRPGKIKIHAEVLFPGVHAPEPADLEIESVPYKGYAFCNDSSTSAVSTIHDAVQQNAQQSKKTYTEEQKRQMLKEVEQQQADFGIAK